MVPNYVSLLRFSTVTVCITYRPEDEQHADVKPDRIADNLAQAVDFILSDL